MITSHRTRCFRRDQAISTVDNIVRIEINPYRNQFLIHIRSKLQER